MENALTGVAPQNIATNAPGVSLTRRETIFLHYMASLIRKGELVRGAPIPEKFMEYGLKCGLREVDVRYIKEWVICKGEHWMACEKAGIVHEMDMRKAYRNPEVRKLINVAASRGLCFGTVASKEELADFYTRRMRSDFLPEQFRDSAAASLARLMAYNPGDEKGASGGVNIQINCVNPYAPMPEMVETATGEVVKDES